MSNFERSTSGQASRTEPELSLYRNGDARLNQPAVEQYLEGVDSIAFYTDGETDRLGINRGDEGPHSKTVQVGDHGGFAFYIGALLREEFDLPVKEISESMALPVEHDLKEGLLVVDLDPFMEANDAE
jgi:hypothetical protein